MSDDSVDKLDYYESFEIYKNATNRIIEKARANRSFSFEDTPVDPRKLVAGHNLKDLKSDEDYVPKVKRVDFGTEQRKVKTKQERIHDRYLVWCESWVKEMNDLLEVEVDYTIEDIGLWLRLASSLRSKVERERVQIGFSEPHYLDSELGDRERSLNERYAPLLEERDREQAEEAKRRSDKVKEKDERCMLIVHRVLLSYYFFHYEALGGGDKLPFISTDMRGIKLKGKGCSKSRSVLNRAMKRFLGKFGEDHFEEVKIHHVLDKMGETARFNQIAVNHMDHLYSEIDYALGYPPHEKGHVRYYDHYHYFVSLCSKYDPNRFLNGIDGLRTTLKEMKNHGATKEEQEGRNQSEEKDS